MKSLEFSELPTVENPEELRRIHQTAGLFFVKRAGMAHAALDCAHLEDSVIVANPVWQVATDAQCRAFGIPWCDDCA